MKVLRFIYSYTHNYGVAIILITVLIKIIFFPLSQKSFRSMNEMKKVQPYIKIIQERYKDDKAMLNQEMMKVYKEHKVNPLGGCMPMLLQVPVFIALYNALLVSIELRGAPFMLWIQDLSEKDPYYVTPILMGASMFVQQKMTPTMGDPLQAKMMQFLPLIFTFMFLNFPVGLVIYWLVNNVLTIAQQYYMNHYAAVKK
jgi:YidC/Oxa1 family membrane protein insertase